MKPDYHIDWTAVAGEVAGLVRPESRDKYFPKNPLRQAVIGRFMAAVAGALEGAAWETLLDAGCGEGFVDYYLARFFSGRGLIGADSDLAALTAARRINPGARYVRADIRSLPFGDASFDAALCTEVIEHLLFYPEALGEVRRVARRVCVVTVPAWPWYQAVRFAVGKDWSRWGEHPGHAVSFSRSSFQAALAGHVGGAVEVRLCLPWLIGRCRFEEEA